jgi:hypothetical protein
VPSKAVPVEVLEDVEVAEEVISVPQTRAAVDLDLEETPSVPELNRQLATSSVEEVEDEETQEAKPHGARHAETVSDLHEVDEEDDTESIGRPVDLVDTDEIQSLAELVADSEVDDEEPEAITAEDETEVSAILEELEEQADEVSGNVAEKPFEARVSEPRARTRGSGNTRYPEGGPSW